MKRIFTIAMALSALGLILAGCQQGGGDAGATGKETSGATGTTPEGENKTTG